MDKIGKGNVRVKNDQQRKLMGLQEFLTSELIVSILLLEFQPLLNPSNTPKIKLPKAGI